ncbi:MAG: hypothetical protein IJV69_04895, partial [Kiritimatiellae bacterium]|nr:hypothetical protein [Kiritimatiellia bacterium]
KHRPASERDLGLEVIDAQCDKGDDVLSVLNQAEESLYTDSFFGGGKVVWLRDANFMPGVKGRAVESQAAKEGVAAFCETLQQHPLPAQHHLIITTDSCPQTSKFAKWIKTAGKFEVCGEDVRSFNLEKIALERLAPLLEKSGLTMSRTVQAAFVQRVGADSRTLVSELEKLRTYLNAGVTAVSLDDLDAVTSTSVSGEPFDLVTALQKRSPIDVAKAVERLRSDKNAAFPTAVVVLNTLNDLCAISDALEHRWLANGQWRFEQKQLPQRLARQQGWTLNKLIEAAKRYTLQELRAARHYAIEMRFKLVDSTAQDPWAIIEPVLLRIVSRRKGRQ